MILPFFSDDRFDARFLLVHEFVMAIKEAGCAPSGPHTVFKAIFDNAAVGRSRLGQLLGKLVHRGVAVVANHQVFVCIEHREPFRNIVYRGLESKLLLSSS